MTAELIALGALVTGIEPSEEALAVAREHVPAAAFFQAELHDIPLQLRRRRFSAVYAGEGTLSLVPDLAAWLSTVAAALRKGGRLVLCDWHPVAQCIEPVGLRWRESYFERRQVGEIVTAVAASELTARGSRRGAAHVEGTGRPADPLRAAGGREEVRLAWARRQCRPAYSVILALAAAAFLGRRLNAATPRLLRRAGAGPTRRRPTACRTRSRRTSSTPSTRSRPTAPTATSSDAPLIARDLAAIDSWWIAQDPTRTLRWDLQAFPGCDSLFGGLDISFLRLPLPASAYADPENGGYSNLVRGLSASFLDPYKKYEVFYDGPIDPNAGVCGVSSFGPTTEARATHSHSCRRTRPRAAAGRSATATTWPRRQCTR